MTSRKSLVRLAVSAGVGLAISAAASFGAMAQPELKIAYKPSPIHNESVKMFQKWGEANGVKITLDAIPYNVFMEKVTATLTTGGDQYDVIWHNDDWGQLWKKWLEPITEKEILDLVAKKPLEAFINDDGQNTVVPMAHTFGVFFYRTDLIKESELPKTWDEMVAISKKLQSEGKVEHGFVGGMSMNNTWFTWFWAMWTNECDILAPIYERDNAKLAAAGWKAALDQPCMTEVAEFWWDAMNKHKISPKGMPSYDRNAANAIFAAGKAAFTVSDSVHYGDFNNSDKSKVAGNVSIGKFPLGPRAKNDFAWNEIWGWAIPKGVPEERKKLAKQMLLAMMRDSEGQMGLWKATGGPPPNVTMWDDIAKQDPFMKRLKEVSLDITPPTHAAYYFPKWPAVHKAFSNAVIKAVTGSREDIAKNLAGGMDSVHKAATE
jgi:ABC-type glycerol-3-phosphate transport system substrate-binding protein